MRISIKKLILILSVLLLAVSCNREETDATTTNPSATSGFTWMENDPNGAVKTAATSELRTQYKSIFAFDSSNATLFEINLTGTAPATYDLATSGNAFYFKDMATGGAITGKVIITSNSGGKASGTFEAFTSGTGITRVYGTFKDIIVK